MSRKVNNLIMINIVCPSRYKINRKQIRKQVIPLPNSIINVIFVGKNKMKFLANKYKKEDYLPPKLSFYYKDENLVEVFICYPQAVLMAAEKNKKLDDIVVYLINHSLNQISV